MTCVKNRKHKKNVLLFNCRQSAPLAQQVNNVNRSVRDRKKVQFATIFRGRRADNEICKVSAFFSFFVCPRLMCIETCLVVDKWRNLYTLRWQTLSTSM